MRTRRWGERINSFWRGSKGHHKNARGAGSRLRSVNRNSNDGHHPAPDFHKIRRRLTAFVNGCRGPRRTMRSVSQPQALLHQSWPLSSKIGWVDGPRPIPAPTPRAFVDSPHDDRDHLLRTDWHVQALTLQGFCAAGRASPGAPGFGPANGKSTTGDKARGSRRFSIANRRHFEIRIVREKLVLEAASMRFHAALLALPQLALPCICSLMTVGSVGVENYGGKECLPRKIEAGE